MGATTARRGRSGSKKKRVRLRIVGFARPRTSGTMLATGTGVEDPDADDPGPGVADPPPDDELELFEP